MADKMDFVREKITNAIIEAMETAGTDWKKSWTGSTMSRPLMHDGKPYRGINTVWLGMNAANAGYNSPYWLSFKRIKALGGKIRKGTKGTMSVFFKPITKRSTNADGDEETSTIRLLRYYNVWNADAVEGLPERFYPNTSEDLNINEDTRCEMAEEFFSLTGADITHSDEARCYYRPSTDSIHMPHFERFESGSAYYATLAHEVVHWTGHESRTARCKKSWATFGSEDYAKEELVAELGAAFLCNELGISEEPRPDHAKYLNSWLKVLKSDKKFIFTAAAAASYAVTWVNKEVEARKEVAEDRKAA